MASTFTTALIKAGVLKKTHKLMFGGRQRRAAENKKKGEAFMKKHSKEEQELLSKQRAQFKEDRKKNKK